MSDLGSIEIAQYGIYASSESTDFSASVSVGPVFGSELSAKKRRFRVHVLAFTPYQALRADRRAEIRHALGVTVDISAQSVNGDVKFSLGAVAAQVQAEGLTANYEVRAVGGSDVELLAAVNQAVDQAGQFSAATLTKLGKVISHTLPEILEGKKPSEEGSATTAATISFSNYEVPIAEYPDFSRLIVFAMQKAADGLSFSEAFELAKDRFDNGFDPRPIEYAYQEVGAGSADGGNDAVRRAFAWIHKVDEYVAEFKREREHDANS